MSYPPVTADMSTLIAISATTILVVVPVMRVMVVEDHSE